MAEPRNIKIYRFLEKTAETPLSITISIDAEDRWRVRIPLHQVASPLPLINRWRLPRFLHRLIVELLGGRIVSITNPRLRLPSRQFPYELELWGRVGVMYVDREEFVTLLLQPFNTNELRIEVLIDALLDRFGGSVERTAGRPTAENPVVIRGMFLKLFQKNPLRAMGLFSSQTQPVYVFYDGEGGWVVRFALLPEYKTDDFRRRDAGRSFVRLLQGYLEAQLQPFFLQQLTRGEPTVQEPFVARFMERPTVCYVDEDGDWVIRISANPYPRTPEELVEFFGGSIQQQL